MNRNVVAALWLAGTIVPLVAGVVFLFGCCVLPFHRELHDLGPICEIASHLTHGGHHDEQQSAPAREKEEPARRFALETNSAFGLEQRAPNLALPGATSTSSYRDFIAHGAVRCDQDVGLHILAETFLI